jgi:hypothetical protein
MRIVFESLPLDQISFECVTNTMLENSIVILKQECDDHPTYGILSKSPDNSNYYFKSLNKSSNNWSCGISESPIKVIKSFVPFHWNESFYIFENMRQFAQWFAKEFEEATQ